MSTSDTPTTSTTTATPATARFSRRPSPSRLACYRSAALRQLHRPLARLELAGHELKDFLYDHDAGCLCEFCSYYHDGEGDDGEGRPGEVEDIRADLSAMAHVVTTMAGLADNSLMPTRDRSRARRRLRSRYGYGDDD